MSFFGKNSLSLSKNFFFFIRKTQNLPKYIPNFNKYNTMSAVDTPVDIKLMLERVQRIIPRLSDDRHKGQAGRIGIIGGSLEYTGAPYYAGIAALRVGSDLVHVFCHSLAGPVIKSYSPELIVHPILDCNNALDKIEPWLERLHVLVIGPGLGRDWSVLSTVIEIIKFCGQTSKPLVIDADGLYIIQTNKELLLDHKNVILTPNAIEFSRLFGADRELIPSKIKSFGNGITILEKGKNDRIHFPRTVETYQLPMGGSGRRCGGQGDLLSGALATFYHWALQSTEPNPEYVAIFAASYLIKQCNLNTFQKLGRSMLATDMIKEIHYVFEDYYEPPSLSRQ